MPPKVWRCLTSTRTEAAQPCINNTDAASNLAQKLPKVIDDCGVAHAVACFPPRGWISHVQLACAVQVHRPAVWLHKCVSDHAAVHRAPLVAVLLNSIFQVVSFPVLTLPGNAAPSSLQPGNEAVQRVLGALAAPEVASGKCYPGRGRRTLMCWEVCSSTHPGHTRSGGASCNNGLLGPVVGPGAEAERQDLPLCVLQPCLHCTSSL